MSKNIAIIAPISDFVSVYSVSTVIFDHCKLLSNVGYNVTLFAGNDFKNYKSYSFHIRPVLISYSPSKIWELNEDFENEVSKNLQILNNELTSYNFCITHDVTFLPFFYPLNLAIRFFSAEVEHIFWLHWLHSVPNFNFDKGKINLKYNSSKIKQYIFSHELKNSYIVFPNKEQSENIAKYYNVKLDRIKTIPNSINPITFLNISKNAIDILQRVDFINRDVLIIYPSRLTLSKKFDKVIKLVAYMNRNGIKASVVFCNTYMQNITAKSLLEYYIKMRDGLEITQNEVLFISELGYEHGLPQNVVKDLFLSANVFVFPSVTEASSLTLFEASLTYNLIFLNRCVESFREFTTELTYFIDFEKDENKWLKDIYNCILYELNYNKILSQRQYVLKNFNNKSLFENHIFPLLE